ncbi:DMT family transporter [Candidatus Woesebacteria bacterium]|nr:DMT family transporter [Candidatus Woesebacteria bacterium]
MKKISAYSLYILIAAILWGFDGILRRNLYVLPPMIIVFYEHLIGLILLTPMIPALLKKEKLTQKEWLSIVFVSLLSGLLGTLWFTTALIKTNFISFSVVFLLQKLQPIFTVITANIILKEKISKKYISWALLAFAAAYFVTFKNGIINFQTGEGTIIAALFAVAAAFAWGSSTAFSRFTLINHSNTLITGLRFFFTTLFSLVGVYLYRMEPQLLSVDTKQLSQLLIIALSTGMFALWLYYKGLKHTQAKISTILELAFPLTAIIIDVFVYKNILAPTQYLAAVVLIFAIFKISQLNKNSTK